MKHYDKITTYFKENWFIVLPMCITALLFNGLMCLIPLLEGQTINSLKSGDFNIVKYYVIIFFSLVIFIQLNRFGKRYLVRVFGNKISLRMRELSLQYLLAENMQYFDKVSAGDILNRNISDIYDTTEGIRKMTTEVFDTIVLLVGYMVSLFFLDVKIALWCLLFATLSIVSAQVMKRFVYKANKSYKEYLSIYKQDTLSILSNELNYRGLGVKQAYQDKYDYDLAILRKKSQKSLLFQSSLEPLYSIVAWIGVFFIIYLSGRNVINGIYEIGTFSAILTTYLLVAKKSAKVGKVFNAYQAFKISWKRCKGYLVTKDVSQMKLIETNDILLLKDYSFSYPNGFHTSKINLEISLGQRVGICGKVHSGKSSLLRGLTGIYSYEGTAQLGGIDIFDIEKIKENLISYTSNQVMLFSDTIENNIALDRIGDVNKAIEASGLIEDIENMGGKGAILSHSIANISGGQQKRLQLARAIYPSSKLLLLDDPFQSVHPAMAMNIVDHLIFKDRIVLLVSNQKNILQKMNKIIFLDDEKAHIDTFENLMRVEAFKELMEKNI